MTIVDELVAAIQEDNVSMMDDFVLKLFDLGRRAGWILEPPDVWRQKVEEIVDHAVGVLRGLRHPVADDPVEQSEIVEMIVEGLDDECWNHGIEPAG